MSLWLSYGDKDGRRKLMSVGGPDPFTMLGLVGIGVALLLPVIQWLREFLR